ncbi:RNA polymerase sigma-54 factor, partial [Candidatus Neomarinimicrobiota bacterium]
MPSLQQTQKLAQHLSPQQILQSSMLQLNSLMIEARILQEMEQNPALEFEEEDYSSEEEPIQEAEDAEDDIDWDELLNSPDDYNVSRYQDHSRETTDIQIAASEEFIENLAQQLADLGMDEEDIQIADEILGNIDLEGYLSVDPQLIADRFHISASKVHAVREQIMALNPAGVAALDLRECLLAQLKAKELDGLAMKIVSNHFDDFANRRYNRIMQALDCDADTLQDAMDLISRLNPKPGAGRETSVLQEYIVPDILVEEVNGKWIVTLNDGSLPGLNVNSTYLNMLSDRKTYDTETRQFARKKVEAAKWFLQAVQHRRETIVRVMEAIIERQD